MPGANTRRCAYFYFDHWQACGTYVHAHHVKSAEHWRHGSAPANQLAR